MSKQKRTRFEVGRDLSEAREKMAASLRRRDYAMVQVFAGRVASLTKELEALDADERFWRQERNQDPSLSRWAARTLALTLNMADLAIYYHDLFMLYMKERGFEPLPEWRRRAEHLKKAAGEFRQFTSAFFQGKNIDAYAGQMEQLMEMVSRRCYTDRERKYLEEYEGK